MQLSILAIAALSIGSAFAQTPSSSDAKVHVVKVGGPNGTLTYTPDSLVVAVGEFVQFQYSPKNHSVIQSTFANPCMPIAGSATEGIFSGYMPVAADASTVPVFTILVNDTKPKWFYCGQAKHCQMGMNLVINVNTTSNASLAAYRAAAALVPESASPPIGTGSNGANSTTSSSSSSSSGTSSGSGSSSNTSLSSTSAVPTPQVTNVAPAVRVGSALGLVGGAAVLFALL